MKKEFICLAKKIIRLVYREGQESFAHKFTRYCVQIVTLFFLSSLITYSTKVNSTELEVPKYPACGIYCADINRVSINHQENISEKDYLHVEYLASEIKKILVNSNIENDIRISIYNSPTIGGWMSFSKSRINIDIKIQRHIVSNVTSLNVRMTAPAGSYLHFNVCDRDISESDINYCIKDELDRFLIKGFKGWAIDRGIKGQK